MSSKFNAMFYGVGTPVLDEEIAKHMATLLKSNCGTGKELSKNMSLVTKTLEFKFGVTSRLTRNNTTGEIEDGNFASSEIVEIFAQNGCIMRCLYNRVKQYKMQDATTITKLLDKTVAANNGKWGGPVVNMLEEVKTLLIEEVLEYTSGILK